MSEHLTLEAPATIVSGSSTHSVNAAHHPYRSSWNMSLPHGNTHINVTCLNSKKTCNEVGGVVVNGASLSFNSVSNSCSVSSSALSRLGRSRWGKGADHELLVSMALFSAPPLPKLARASTGTLGAHKMPPKVQLTVRLPHQEWMAYQTIHQIRRR